MQQFHNPLTMHALHRVFLFVLLGLLAVSCNNSDGHKGIESNYNQNILRFDIHAPIGSLDPIETTNNGYNELLPFLYSHLFTPNMQGELEPDLALDWSYSAESLTWTIKLRPDARFHNGKIVTAQDVAFSLEKWISEFSRDLSATIDKFTPVSPVMLKILLNKNDPYLLYKIWDFEIFPKADNARSDHDTRPVGSGPYRYESREGNQSVTLKANPDYYGGPPSIGKVIFYSISDKERSWTRLLRGETDIMADIRSKHYNLMAPIREKFIFHRQLHKRYTLMLFNTHNPLFADKRVRQALALAVDRNAIIEKILQGFGEVANGPMGVNSPFHNPNATHFTYDPNKSQRLLKQAGWTKNSADGLLYRNGKPFKFVIRYMEGLAIDERVARYIKLCLAEVGVEATIESLKYDILIKRYFNQKRFQSVITEFSGTYRNPEWLKKVWAATPPEKSIAGCFYHPQVSAVIDRALKENDPTKQRALFYQAEALINDLQPGIFLFHKYSVDVMASRIHLPYPFSLDYAGICRLRHAEIQ